jgi:porin
VEGFWNVNALVTALPWFRWVNLSMWGGGAWYNDKEGRITGGLLALGTENVTTTGKWDDSFDDGVGLFGFWRFFYELGDKPGYLLFAGGHSTKKFNSLDPSDFVPVPGVIPLNESTDLIVPGGIEDTEEKRPWDVAGYLYQVFWQAAGDPKRHAHVFIGGTVADDNPSWSNGNIFAAIEAFGPMASRPHDRMGISGWYSFLSDDFVDLVGKLGIDLRDTWGFELYYNLEINPWLHLTPDIQFIRNEIKGDDIAVVPGVRLVMDF